MGGPSAELLSGVSADPVTKLSLGDATCTGWGDVPLPVRLLAECRRSKKLTRHPETGKKSPLPSHVSLQHPLWAKPNIEVVGRREVSTGSGSGVSNRAVKGDIEAERQFTGNWHRWLP